MAAKDKKKRTATTIEVANPPQNLALDDDAKQLAVGGDSSSYTTGPGAGPLAVVYQLEAPFTPVPLARTRKEGHTPSGGSVAFLGKDIVVAFSELSNGGRTTSCFLALFDSQGRLLAETPPIDASSIQQVVTSADGASVAAGIWGGDVCVWTAEALRDGSAPRRIRVGGEKPEVAFDGNELYAAVSIDNELELVKIGARDSVSRQKTGVLGSIRGFPAGSDQRFLIRRSDTWDVLDATGKSLAELRETFFIATLDRGLVIGATGHASTQKRSGWKPSPDKARKRGFIGIADARTGELQKIVPLALEPGVHARAIAVRSEKVIAVGSDWDIQIFAWSDVVG